MNTREDVHVYCCIKLIKTTSTGDINVHYLQLVLHADRMIAFSRYLLISLSFLLHKTNITMERSAVCAM
jgi:hypothetical protein